MSPDLQPYYDALKQNKEAQKAIKDVLTDKQTQKAFKDVLNDEQAMRGINYLLKNEEFKQQALAQLGGETSLKEDVSVLKYEEIFTFVRQIGRCLEEHDAPASQYQKYDSQDNPELYSQDNPNDITPPNDNSSSGISRGTKAEIALGVLAIVAIGAIGYFCGCCRCSSDFKVRLAGFEWGVGWKMERSGIQLPSLRGLP
jgi:hypothetical protein